MTDELHEREWGKNEKLSIWGFVSFPQTCREGQRTDGHFGARTVNHRVQKQYDFLLNLKKRFVVSINGPFLGDEMLSHYITVG